MTGTILFDADCGFCTKAAEVMRRLPLGVSAVPLQSVDLASLGVSEVRALVELPYVDAGGSVVYGHRAVAAALRTGRFPLRVLGHLITAPGISAVARGGYRWTARHRHQLPGGTQACAIPDQSSARR